MKRFCFRLLLCALVALPLGMVTSQSGKAQVQFQVAIGDANGQRGHSIKQLPDSGYIIAGTYYRLGIGEDVYLARIGKQGNLVWSYYYDFAGGSCQAYSVDIAWDGGFVLTGSVFSVNNCCNSEDAFLMQTDDTGVLKWIKIFGGCGSDAGNYVQRTSDTGYVVAGRTDSFGAGDIDGLLIKTDRYGARQWIKVYGDSAREEFYGAHDVPGDGYIAVGFTESYATTATSALTRQAFAVRTKNNGALRWACHYGGSGGEELYSVRRFDGGFITVGSSDSYSPTADIFMVKLNGAGAFSWAWRYGYPAGADIAYSVKEAPGDTLIVAGEVDGAGFALRNAYLLKTNKFGAKEWSHIYGGAGNDNAREVVATSDGGFAFAGITDSFFYGMDDVYAVKTNGVGTTPCKITTATETAVNYASLPVFSVTPTVASVNVICTSTAARYAVAQSTTLCTSVPVTTCCCTCNGVTVCVPCTNPSMFVCPCDTTTPPPQTTCCCTCNGVTTCVPCTNPSVFVCPCDTTTPPPQTTCCCVCNGVTICVPCADPATFVCPCDTTTPPPQTTCCCTCNGTTVCFPCSDPLNFICPCDTATVPPDNPPPTEALPGVKSGGSAGRTRDAAAKMGVLQSGELFRIVPNPVEPGASFALVYSFGASPGGITVAVSDMLGRTVERSTHSIVQSEGTVEIKTAGWAKGMYLVTVKYGNSAKVLPVVVGE